MRCSDYIFPICRSTLLFCTYSYELTIDALDEYDQFAVQDGSSSRCLAGHVFLLLRRMMVDSMIMAGTNGETPAGYLAIVWH